MAKFHPPYEVVVTDGTTRVDITKSPFFLNSWRPSAAATSPNSSATRPRPRVRSRTSRTNPKFWLYTVMVTSRRSSAVDWSGLVGT